MFRRKGEALGEAIAGDHPLALVVSRLDPLVDHLVVHDVGFEEDHRATVEAVGEEVAKSLTPGQALVKIIHNELVSILGGDYAPLDLKAQPPVVILLAGLQGAGKTTSAAKLAKRIIDKDRKRVMLVSVDVHRPAAILQLKTLAGEVGALHCDSDPAEAPVAIVERALNEARRSHADVLIVDTAGRLHIDNAMMDEVAAVRARRRVFARQCLDWSERRLIPRSRAERVTLASVLPRA